MELEETDTHVPLSTPSLRNPNYVMYLEVILHSAKDLQQPRFGTMKPFVSAFLAVPDTEPKDPKKVTFKFYGKNPTWDFMMEFDLTDDICRKAMNYRLFCEIKDHGWLFDTNIGLATIPLKELLAKAGKKIHHKVVSGGKTKGEIIISHALKFKAIIPTTLPSSTDTHESGGKILSGAGDRLKTGASIAATAMTGADILIELTT